MQLPVRRRSARRAAIALLATAVVVVAFLLVGLLQGVNAGFEQTIAAARRDLLTTDARVRGSECTLGCGDVGPAFQQRGGNSCRDHR